MGFLMQMFWNTINRFTNIVKNHFTKIVVCSFALFLLGSIYTKSTKGNVKVKQMLVLLFFSIYTSFILTATVIGRNYYENPLEKILDGWMPYLMWKTWNFDPIYNIVIMIPWAFCFPILYDRSQITSVRLSVVASLLFSLIIETLQLTLSVGTFQISDIVYNSLGGLIGGLLFFKTRQHRSTHHPKGPLK